MAVTLVVLLSGLGVWFAVERSSAPEVEPIPAQTVQVTLEGIEGVNGWDLAGLLYGTTAYNDIVGGFITTADSDPFTTTQAITPTPLFSNEPRSEEAVVLEPGTYYLMLFAGPDLVGSNEWYPVGRQDTSVEACSIALQIEEGEGTAIAVSGGFAEVTSAAEPECLNPIQIEHTSTMTWGAAGMPVEVYNGIPGVEDYLGWGLGRFDRAGLPVPNIGSVTFLLDESRCHGYFGIATNDPNGSVSTIALCYRADQICADASCDTWNPTYRAALLHEYAHAWISQHVDGATRTEFLDLVGVPNWTDPDIPHRQQGTEYAANTIVYGLLDANMPALLALPLDCDQIEEAFRLLTGAEPIAACQP